MVKMQKKVAKSDRQKGKTYRNKRKVNRLKKEHRQRLAKVKRS